MWHLGTWSSGGLDSMRSVVGVDGLRGLIEPKRFNDSLIIILSGAEMSLCLPFVKKQCVFWKLIP